MSDITTQVQRFLLLASVAFLLAGSNASAQRTSGAEKVDFERHVAPLLGRLGCNSAACHGAFGGKGGMQFSLFGYSARMDYKSLQSRVDTDDPADSLMLLKPTGAEDHEGGTPLKPRKYSLPVPIISSL